LKINFITNIAIFLHTFPYITLTDLFPTIFPTAPSIVMHNPLPSSFSIN